MLSDRQDVVIRCCLAMCCCTLACRQSTPASTQSETSPSASSISVSSPHHQSDWAGLLGPDQNGTTAPLQRTIPFGSRGPDVNWRIPIGTGYSAPVADSRRVVVSHRIGDQEHVDAYSLESGQRLWRVTYPTQFHCRYEYSSGPYSTPAIWSDAVYAWSAEGQLRCIDIDEGRVRWTRDLSTDFDVPTGDFPVSASPIVMDGQIVLNVGGQKKSAGVVALSAASGKTTWTVTEEPAAYATPVLMQRQHQIAVLVLGYDHLLGIDWTSGELLWSHPFHARNRDLGKLNATSPLVDGDHIYLAAFGKGAAKLNWPSDAAEPQVVWEVGPRQLSNQMAPLVRCGVGLLGYSTTNKTFRCLDPIDGESLWQWRSEIGREPQYLMTGTCVIMLGENGELVSFDASKVPLEMTSKMNQPLLQGPCFTTPTLSHGRLLVRNETELVCCELRESIAK